MKNPTKAIRQFCIDCMGGHQSYVTDCPSGGCPLHAFRMGNNPYNKKNLSDEQRMKIAERLKSTREKVKNEN